MCAASIGKSKPWWRKARPWPIWATMKSFTVCLRQTLDLQPVSPHGSQTRRYGQNLAAKQISAALCPRGEGRLWIFKPSLPTGHKRADTVRTVPRSNNNNARGRTTLDLHAVSTHGSQTRGYGQSCAAKQYLRLCDRAGKDDCGSSSRLSPRVTNAQIRSELCREAISAAL